MNLELTPAQLKELVRLTFIGEMIVNEDVYEDTAMDTSAHTLHSLIVQKAFENKSFPDMKYDKVLKKHFLSLDTSMEFYGYIDEYNALNFSEKLVELIVENMMLRKHGAGVKKSMHPEAYEEILADMIDEVDEEFVKNDYVHVVLEETQKKVSSSRKSHKSK